MTAPTADQLKQQHAERFDRLPDFVQAIVGKLSNSPAYALVHLLDRLDRAALELDWGDDLAVREYYQLRGKLFGHAESAWMRGELTREDCDALESHVELLI